MSSISVIIPTWNRAAIIEKAIRSALNQTFPPLEVLVCDDGSTDDTRAVVEAIGDSRILWISGARGGRPALPRNRGIRESKGEWLAFLDTDDEWLPNKLEVQLALAQKMGCKAVCSNAHKLVPGVGVVGSYLTLPGEKDILTFNDLLHTNYVICSSAVLHASVMRDAIGFSENPELVIGEDYALWLRVATQTPFAFHKECLLMYLDDASHSIRSQSKSEWIQKKYVLGDFLFWARSLNTNNTDNIDNSYIQAARVEYMKSFVRIYGGAMKVRFAK